MTISKKQLEDVREHAYQMGLTAGYQSGYDRATKDADLKQAVRQAKLELLKSLTEALNANAQALTSVSHAAGNFGLNNLS